MKNQRVNSRVKLAELFKAAIRSYPQPIYRIANDANVCPAVLYRGIRDYDLYRPNDPRFLRIAKSIGYTGQVYETVLSESEQLAGK